MVSQYLHDRIGPGDELQVSAAAGAFTFTASEQNAIVLIGGGVGITPLMCVARALTDSAWQKDIYFLYSCRTPEDFIFREELEYLKARNPNLHVVVTYSRATEDIEGFHHGRITKEIIVEAVPEISGKRVHVCGTPSMAEGIKKILRELGVAPANIKSEAFGTIKRAPRRTDAVDAVPAASATTATFSVSEKSCPLKPGQTVLEAAEDIGVEIDNACRSGTCGSCKVRLTSGSVTMEVEDALSDEDQQDGIILACQAQAESDLTVEA